MNYSLQKYRGLSTRHECPNCHDKHSFTLYVDENGKPLSPICGRCNHESRCGYHLTPGEYFKEHPEAKDVTSSYTLIKKGPQRMPDYIPNADKYIKQSLSLNSNFGKFLGSIIDTYPGSRPHLERVETLYQLGCTKNGGCIFWQRDINGHIRTGKVIQYDPQTGHRKHDAGGINWIHAIMKRQGLLKPDFNLRQCLFGEHLLRYYPDAPVAIVEAEKTAVIGSVLYPLQVWLATGSKQNFKREMLQVLSGRNVTIFPDVDGYEEWKEKANNMLFARFRIFNIDNYADDTDRERKSDVGDWIIESLKKNQQN